MFFYMFLGFLLDTCLFYNVFRKRELRYLDGNVKYLGHHKEMGKGHGTNNHQARQQQRCNDQVIFSLSSSFVVLLLEYMIYFPQTSRKSPEINLREYTILTSFSAALILVPSTGGFYERKRSCILAKMIFYQGDSRDSEGYKTMISLVFFVFLEGATVETFLLTLLVIQLGMGGQKRTKGFFILIDDFLATVFNSILSNNNGMKSKKGRVRKIDKRQRFSDMELVSARTSTGISRKTPFKHSTIYLYTLYTCTFYRQKVLIHKINMSKKGPEAGRNPQMSLGPQVPNAPQVPQIFGARAGTAGSLALGFFSLFYLVCHTSLNTLAPCYHTS